MKNYLEYIMGALFLIGIPVTYAYFGVWAAVLPALLVAALNGWVPLTQKELASRKEGAVSFTLGRAIGALIMALPATGLWWLLFAMPVSTAWLLAFATCFASLELRLYARTSAA